MCAKHPPPLPIKPACERREIAGVVMGINQKLIRIDHQAPMVMGVAHLQPCHPIQPKPRRAIAMIGVPQGHIGLRRQIGARAIGAVIVDDQEMPHAQTAIMHQRKRQSGELIAQGHHQQDVPARDALGAVHNRHQLMPAAKTTP